MKKKLIFFIVFQLFVSIIIAEESGKLEEFEDELNKPIQNNNDNETEEFDFDNENEENDEEEGEENFFNKLFWSLVYEIFIGSEPSFYTYEFQPYIYYDNYSGRYAGNGTTLDADLDIKYIYNSKDLKGISLNGSFFFTRVMNLKCNYQKLNEKLENDQDKMELYEIFVDYYRARLPNFNWFWGIGAKGLNRTNSYLGFAVNTGFEIYPIKPLSIELAANIGWLNLHPVSKINTDFNIHYWRIKFSVGYQRLKTGNAEINSVNLGLGFNF